MWGRRWRALVLVPCSACLTIPTFTPTDGQPSDAAYDAFECSEGQFVDDRDCDGWPTRGAAPDCNDDDASVHPGLVNNVGGPSVDCMLVIPAGMGLDRVARDGRRIDTRTLSMAFGVGGAQLPESLSSYLFPQPNLFFDSAGCTLAEERLAGFYLYPGFSANQSSGAFPSMVTATWAIPIDGPAMTRIHVETAGSYDCNSTGTDNQVNSTHDFTFFPDGRVIRYDAVAPVPGLPTDDCSPCGGPQSPITHVTTAYSFATTSELTHHATSLSPMMSSSTSSESSTSIDGWQCFGNQLASGRIGVAWSTPDPAEGWRLRVSPGFFASVLDWDVNLPGVTLLDDYRAASALWIFEDPGTDCDAILPRVAAYQHPDPIGSIQMDQTTGVYMVQGSSPPALEVLPGFTGVQISVTSMPTGFAIDIPLESAHGLTVWLSPGGAPFERLQANLDYQTQPSPMGSRYLVWIPGEPSRPLDDSDRLVILAPGADLPAP
jgi:hypothetical protein